MEQLYIGAKWINSPRCMPGTILEEQRIHRDEEEVLGRCNISAASALHHLEHVHLNHVPNVVSAAKLEFQTEVLPRATEHPVVDSLFAMMPDKSIARSLCHRNVIVKRHLQCAIAPIELSTFGWGRDAHNAACCKGLSATVPSKRFPRADSVAAVIFAPSQTRESSTESGLDASRGVDRARCPLQCANRSPTLCERSEYTKRRDHLR